MVKYGSKANFSTKSCSKLLELIESRNCLECKKLLETKKVVRNTRSYLKIAEQLVESPSVARFPKTLLYL